MPRRTLGPKGGWIIRSTLIEEENETFFIRVWKPLAKNFEWKLEGESSNETISIKLV